MTAHNGLQDSQKVAGLFRAMCIIVRLSVRIKMT
jgi:hypothetical protein